MNKRKASQASSEGAEATRVDVGIDVSARELAVAAMVGEKLYETTVANTAAGHRELLQWSRRKGKRLRVCLEASGNYSLDVALMLQGEPDVELSMLNPRRARRFAESLGERNKLDPVDARALAEYAQRMKYEPWHPPSSTALHLRSLTRTIHVLVTLAAEQKNREHAVNASHALPGIVAEELVRHQQYLGKRIRRLREQALRLIQSDAKLRAQLQHLLSMPGIGEASALTILGELATMSEGLDARQWVAHSGLDPRHYESGTSVKLAPHISRAGNRRLRKALYMPALVAVHHDPHLGRFYRRLVERGKAKMAALCAVMRKMLHGIHAMFRRDEDYCGERLCAA